MFICFYISLHKGVWGLLASVLGGQTKQIDQTYDLNNLIQPGIVYTWGENPPQHADNIGYGSIYNRNGGGSSIHQVMVVRTNIASNYYFRIREGGNWSLWRRNYDASILNDSTILSPLATALGDTMGVLCRAQNIEANGTFATNIPAKGLLIIRSSGTVAGTGIIALAGPNGTVFAGGTHYNIDNSGMLLNINLTSTAPYNFTITNKENALRTIYYMLLQV